MNKKLGLHYFIAIAAVLVVIGALYEIYLYPESAKSLILTVLGCALVAVGQFVVIKKKRKL